MGQNKDLEQVLKQALSPENKPDQRLNEAILNQYKEMEQMKKFNVRRIPAAAVIAAIGLSVGTMSVYGAWKFLTPAQVAQQLEEEGIQKAFQGKDAIIINETKECGEKRVTLLGMVTGKNLRKYVENEEVSQSLQDKKTYIVTAIENKDGTKEAMESMESFVVSPLVKGLKPWEFNVFLLNGGAFSIVENGIQYSITECDDIEIFANRGLYLAVTDGAPGADQYSFNEKTGEITRNEAYKGMNLLFDLPIDKSKADEKAAKEYLKELEKKRQGESSEAEASEQEVADLDLNTIKEQGVLQEELTQTILPDEDGNFSYEYSTASGSGVDAGPISVKYMFEKEKEVFYSYYSSGEENSRMCDVLTLNEDGSITLNVYKLTK